MNEANKLWWRSVGPSLAVIALVGIVNGAWVYRQHRDGSQNDVAQLLWPAHYVVQKPEQGAFDDACVSAGWAELTRGAKPSFAPGVDRERALGILPVDAATQLRVSLREPKRGRACCRSSSWAPFLSPATMRASPWRSVSSPPSTKHVVCPTSRRPSAEPSLRRLAAPSARPS